VQEFPAEPNCFSDVVTAALFLSSPDGFSGSAAAAVALATLAIA